NHAIGKGGDAGEPVDLTFELPDADAPDLTPTCDDPLSCDRCGEVGFACFGFGPGVGHPFPLPTDMPADPQVPSSGVGRDKNGYLTLDSSHASFDYIYAANTSDWARGTLTKID